MSNLDDLFRKTFWILKSYSNLKICMFLNAETYFNSRARSSSNLKNASGPKSVFTRTNFFFLKICFQLRSQKVLKCTKSSSFFPSSWSKLYRIVWSLFALWILFSTNYSCRHLSALSVREISNVVEFTRLR